MTTMYTEPCKILDGRWRCCNCNLPRAIRWGVVTIPKTADRIGGRKEGWWCQTCIDAILCLPPTGRLPAS